MEVKCLPHTFLLTQPNETDGTQNTLASGLQVRKSESQIRKWSPNRTAGSGRVVNHFPVLRGPKQPCQTIKSHSQRIIISPKGSSGLGHTPIVTTLWSQWITMDLIRMKAPQKPSWWGGTERYLKIDQWVTKSLSNFLSSLSLVISIYKWKMTKWLDGWHQLRMEMLTSITFYWWRLMILRISGPKHSVCNNGDHFFISL